jgi:hypothetical protein
MTRFKCGGERAACGDTPVPSDAVWWTIARRSARIRRVSVQGVIVLRVFGSYFDSNLELRLH